MIFLPHYKIRNHHPTACGIPLLQDIFTYTMQPNLHAYQVEDKLLSVHFENRPVIVKIMQFPRAVVCNDPTKLITTFSHVL